MDDSGIARAAELVQGARRIVALTGAGISRGSGIPDFRSEDGLWARADPMAVASLAGFRSNPHLFYDWVRPLVDTILAAEPNPAHQALARLERAGRLQAVVTQNIDGLHQRAGSRQVYELHGHLRSATCLECDSQVPAAPLLRLVRQGRIPRCSCGGLLKPDVVLFDEMLPRGLFWLAQRAVEQCELLLVAGTALEVAPVCEMPLAAMRRGARVIIINQGATYLDASADLVLHADVAQALPAIVDCRMQTAD